MDEVLDMNPRQIMAMVSEKSFTPGLLEPNMIKNGIRNLKDRIHEW